MEHSPCPEINLDDEKKLQAAITVLIRKQLIHSAHDLSEGGLFVSLAESGFFNELGFNIQVETGSMRKDAYWFGETQSRALLSVHPDKKDEVLQLLQDGGVEAILLGTVTEGDCVINGESMKNIQYWKDLYNNAIGNFLANSGSGDALSAI